MVFAGIKPPDDGLILSQVVGAAMHGAGELAPAMLDDQEVISAPPVGVVFETVNVAAAGGGWKVEVPLP